ncbi:MAG: chorismate lyase [Burkholderiaceae bacterium]|nr:chorismate lyase [Burkholderiaceae bacterium]
MKSLTDWSPHPLPSFSKDEVRWLFAPGSLTSRLKVLGDYSLELVDQRQCPAIIHDAQALSLSVGSPIWIREVLMRIDERPCIAARSITPVQALEDDWMALAGYGNYPLGDILYSDSTVVRSPFECALLELGDPLETLSRQLGIKAKELRARRSCFVRNGSRLIVSECFLPEFWSTYAG